MRDWVVWRTWCRLRKLVCFHSTRSAVEGASDLKSDMASLKWSSLSERMYNFDGCACFNNAREIPRPTLPTKSVRMFIKGGRATPEFRL